MMFLPRRIGSLFLRGLTLELTGRPTMPPEAPTPLPLRLSERLGPLGETR